MTKTQTLTNHQLFAYWIVGYDQARNRQPYTEKRSWPEEGQEAYLEGYRTGESHNEESAD